MDNFNISGSFVSQKISKMRWLPELLSDEVTFLTGSWDSDTNHIKLWGLVRNPYFDDENEFIPKCSCKINFVGDVSGMEVFDHDNIVVASTSGYISLINIERSFGTNKLIEKSRVNGLHYFDQAETLVAPCTGISIYQKQIATIGEDGRLNVISLNGGNNIQTISSSDSCPLTSIAFINDKEILTGNRMGVIKIFDKFNGKNPRETLLISCEDEKKSNGVTCIGYHPTQNHIVLAGSEEGSITVWDLRNTSFPASYLHAHSSAITELAFHKNTPSKLFTASENGELWQWNQNMFQIPGQVDQMHFPDSDNVNPWLNGERTKSKVCVTSLISGIKKAVNTFDCHGSKIICGCDNEAIYYIDNVF